MNAFRKNDVRNPQRKEKKEGGGGVVLVIRRTCPAWMQARARPDACSRIAAAWQMQMAGAGCASA